MPDAIFANFLTVPPIPASAPPAPAPSESTRRDSFDTHFQRASGEESPSASDQRRTDDATTNKPRESATSPAAEASRPVRTETRESENSQQAPADDERPVGGATDQAGEEPADEESPDDKEAAEIAAAVVAQVVAEAALAQAIVTANEAAVDELAISTDEPVVERPVATTTKQVVAKAADTALAALSADRPQGKEKKDDKPVSEKQTLSAQSDHDHAAQSPESVPNVQVAATAVEVPTETTATETVQKPAASTRRDKKGAELDVSELTQDSASTTADQQQAVKLDVAASLPNAGGATDADPKKSSRSSDEANGVAPVNDAKGTAAGGADAASRTAGTGIRSRQAGENVAGSNGLSDVDRVRFVQRVARAFQAAEENGGEIRLRLSPPALGSLKLEIHVQDGALSAKLQAETDTARNLLLENLPLLRERLAEQNIRVDQFDVDLMDRSPGGLPDTLPGDADSREQGSSGNRQRSGREDGPEPLVSVGGRSVASPDSGRLNVVI